MKLTHTDTYGNITELDVQDAVAEVLLLNEGFAKHADSPESAPAPVAGSGTEPSSFVLATET